MKNMVTIDLNTTVIHSDHLLTTELDGETVMMSLTQAAYYGLDATAQRIWNLIAKPCRVSEVCETLIAEFAVEREVCEQQVCAFLTELNEEGLIRIVDEPT
jgi:hypothetical protein